MLFGSSYYSRTHYNLSNGFKKQSIDIPFTGDIQDYDISDQYTAILEKYKLHVYKNHADEHFSITTFLGSGLFEKRIKIINDWVYVCTDGEISVFDIPSGKKVFSDIFYNNFSLINFETNGDQIIARERDGVGDYYVSDKTIYCIWDFRPKYPSRSFHDKLLNPIKDIASLANTTTDLMSPAVNNTLNYFNWKFKNLMTRKN